MVNSEPAAKEQKILIIVEGARKEVRLLEKLSELYLVVNKQVVSYGANIYDLYSVLESYFGEEFENDESFDLLLALRERECAGRNNPEQKKLLEGKYSDILLIFDFERQDHRFTEEKIRKLMKFFNDSIETGRLYLNYPMVEAFYHLPQNAVQNCCAAQDFYNCRFTEADICGHTYKQRAAIEGNSLNVSDLTKAQMNNIIAHHSKKATFIIKGKYSLCSDYCQEEMLKLLDMQLEDYNRNQAAYVVSTCTFFIPEMYPNDIVL